MLEFAKTIETVQADYLVIGGDFNFPALNWGQQGYQTSQLSGPPREMMNIVQTFHLTQMVTQPTRKSNILDLFLTNRPDWVT